MVGNVKCEEGEGGKGDAPVIELKSHLIDTDEKAAAVNEKLRDKCRVYIDVYKVRGDIQATARNPQLPGEQSVLVMEHLYCTYAKESMILLNHFLRNALYIMCV